ncbi:MAG: AAA family ATPase [Planctomycetia bacterium]|nr:AAA family ATPase [Planctomycetia bacterium]
MQIDVTLKNYRCFPDRYPAKFSLREGTWSAFLGVNNVGKSAVFRFLYEMRNRYDQLKNQASLLQSLKKKNLDGGYLNLRDPSEIFHDQNERDISCEFQFQISGMGSSIELSFSRVDQHVRVSKINGVVVSFEAGNDWNLQTGMELSLGSAQFGSVASILQGFSILTKVIYIGAFRNILNIGGNDQYYDIQVGDQFVMQWDRMKNGNTKSGNRACIEVEHSIKRLLGFNSLSINAAEGRTLQVVINDRPYKLHELGSGIAQLILVLVNTAAQKPSYVMIDEPELSLHPSLQLDFISELGKIATHGVLFSTHNVGLARSCADTIYSVTKLSDGVSTVTQYDATPNLPAFLGELSYSSYQALGFEKILLVEGVTDVRTMQQFLRKLHSDHRILLIPLCGNSLIDQNREYEIVELKRICKNVAALIDSEKDGPDKELDPRRNAFLAMCKKNGINAKVLDYRASENYLTDRAVKAIKGESYRALKSFEKLKALEPHWSKEENWKIAAEMSREEIAQTDLGQFLSSLHQG